MNHEKTLISFLNQQLHGPERRIIIIRFYPVRILIIGFAVEKDIRLLHLVQQLPGGPEARRRLNDKTID